MFPTKLAADERFTKKSMLALVLVNARWTFQMPWTRGIITAW